LQREFLASVREGGERLYPKLAATQGFTASQRMQVYFDAYRLRLVEALADSYPRVLALLGDDDFYAAGVAYAAITPSRHFSIRHFGDNFANFLASSAPYSDAPVLAEMARFEWTLRDVFDAQDDVSVGAEALALVSPERWGELRFRLHATLRRADLHWNVAALWEVLQQEHPSVAVQRTAAAVPWVFWRQELRSYFRSICEQEASALDQLRAGASFGDICEALARPLGADAAPLQAARFLKGWLDRGWLSEVRCS
jgi:hypothetical protein